MATTWRERLPVEVLGAHHRLRVLPGGGGPGELHLGPPRADAELGPYGQEQLRSSYAADPRPTDAGLWYFESFAGRSATDTPHAVFEELRRRRPELRVAWGILDHGHWTPEGVTPVVIGTRAWYDALGTARVLVTNTELEEWYRRRPGQLVVQCFHGYPSKAMGESQWRARELPPSRVAVMRRRSVETWDLISTPTPEMTAVYREQYGYDGPAAEHGYPRNDALRGPGADRVRVEARRLLGIAPDQTAVLYAPTWRDHLASRPRAAAMTEHLDVDAAAASLGDSHVMLLRGHRFHAPGPSRRGVVDVTDHPEINDLVLASDVAVLDYSSLRFDYALTGRPMVFLVPDLDGLHGWGARLPVPVHRHRSGSAGGHDRRGRGRGPRRTGARGGLGRPRPGVRRAVQPLAGRTGGLPLRRRPRTRARRETSHLTSRRSWQCLAHPGHPVTSCAVSRLVDVLRRHPRLYRVARRLARTPPAQMARARLLKPQISVIVPIYNVEEYLPACLDSLQAQTFTDFEVVLVDDGSPDGSRAIAEAYAGRDRRIRIVTRPNGGLGAARNTGVRAARGHFLTFLDSDDELPPQALAVLHHAGFTTGSEIVAGAMERFDSLREWTPSWVPEVHLSTVLRTTVEDHLPLLRNLYTCDKLFRRDFWVAQDLWFREGVAYEDQPLVTQLLGRARSIDIVPDVVYRYRARDDRSSISQQTESLKDLRDRIAAWRVSRDVIRAEFSDAVYDGWLLTLFQAHFQWYLTSPGTEDDTYWHELSSEVRALADEAPQEVWDATDPPQRILVRLAQLDRRGDVQEFVRGGGTAVDSWPSRAREDGVLLELPLLGDPELPDELFVIGHDRLRIAHAVENLHWQVDGGAADACWISGLGLRTQGRPGQARPAGHRGAAQRRHR